MASNEAVVENAVSKLYLYLQFITIAISLFLNERFQLSKVSFEAIDFRPYRQ